MAHVRDGQPALCIGAEYNQLTLHIKRTNELAELTFHHGGGPSAAASAEQQAAASLLHSSSSSPVLLIKRNEPQRRRPKRAICKRRWILIRLMHLGNLSRRPVLARSHVVCCKRAACGPHEMI